jgi:hypothetical protein
MAELYVIQKYNKSKDFIDNGGIKIKLIDDVEKMLKKDEWHNMRIKKNTYVLFGDIKHYLNNISLFCKDLNTFAQQKYNKEKF